jgi:hypothetical protein
MIIKKYGQNKKGYAGKRVAKLGVFADETVVDTLRSGGLINECSGQLKMYLLEDIRELLLERAKSAEDKAAMADILSGPFGICQKAVEAAAAEDMKGQLFPVPNIRTLQPTVLPPGQKVFRLCDMKAEGGHIMLGSQMELEWEVRTL